MVKVIERGATVGDVEDALKEEAPKQVLVFHFNYFRECGKIYYLLDHDNQRVASSWNTILHWELEAAGYIEQVEAVLAEVERKLKVEIELKRTLRTKE